jgi:murein DD-endopeptidase MepM/ murein hydrolase activator NlpD
MSRFKNRRSAFSQRLRRWTWLKKWFEKNPEPLTLLFMTKGNLEVEKLHLSSRGVRNIKLFAVGSLTLLVVSLAIMIQFVLNLPERSMLERENVALKTELNRLQYNLDGVQVSLDRIQRFNQKLRALTEVDREFAKRQGPLGQGGGERAEDSESLDFSEFAFEESSYARGDSAPQVIDRRDQFLIQKLNSWTRRLFQMAELESQSVEELFEVLKGRKLQLAATPSILPVRGWVTSHFGYRIDPFSGRRAFHKGMDISARKGAPIVSPAEGVVSFAGPYGSFGNTVMIFHGYGISTLYAHCEDILVRTGQRISRGDILGTVGNTGRSTADHLHYEVIVHGVRVDPRKYILDRQL